MWSVGLEYGCTIYSFSLNISPKKLYGVLVWCCYVTELHAYHFGIKKWGHYLCWPRIINYWICSPGSAFLSALCCSKELKRLKRKGHFSVLISLQRQHKKCAFQSKEEINRAAFLASVELVISLWSPLDLSIDSPSLACCPCASELSVHIYELRLPCQSKSFALPHYGLSSSVH